MGGLLSYIWRREDPKTPIKGFVPRIVNIGKRHFRGLLGTIIPLILGPLLLDKTDPRTTVLFMWAWMFWSFLLQPVAVPVTGFIPVFLLPMTCTMSSDATCPCYMNEGIALFILGNMVLLLWNNSGLDRRLVLWFLCSGDTPRFSAYKLTLKCCLGSFILSMFSNKLIVSNIMIQYVTAVMVNLKAATKATDPDYNELRYILNNAIQTSSAIGGAAILHSSYTNLAFRAIFAAYSIAPSYIWMDIFNFLEYSIFAMPLCIALFIVNTIYHMILVKFKISKPIPKPSLTRIRNAFLKEKKEIRNKVTLHEKMTLFFSIVTLALYFTRWNKYFSGWASFFNQVTVGPVTVPGVRDATVAAAMAILLHCLPNGFRFVKILLAKKRSELGNPKPQSGILWWRFVDKNIVYGYIFLIGSGIALTTAISHTKYNLQLVETGLGKFLSEQSSTVLLLLTCVAGVVLSNIMSSVAAIVVLQPFIMNVVPVIKASVATTTVTILRDPSATPDATPSPPAIPSLELVYLGALAVGFSASFSFMNPFAYTPAYFCFHTGKVPRKKMAIYGLGSAIICCGILFAFVAFVAPILWASSSVTQIPVGAPIVVTTTPAAGAGGNPDPLPGAGAGG